MLNTHVLRDDISFPVDSYWIEVSSTEILPVVRLSEVVAIVEQKSAVVELDRVADGQVDRREVLFDLLVTQLHDNCWKRRLNVVSVLGYFLAGNEYWKWITAIIGMVDFTDFDGIVHQVIL